MTTLRSPVCRHCDCTLREHADHKCLYAVGSYEPLLCKDHANCGGHITAYYVVVNDVLWRNWDCSHCAYSGGGRR